MEKKMKYLVTLLAVSVITLSAGLIFRTNTAYCWNCPLKRCTFDIECGINCICHKGKYDLEGTCVSEE